MRFPILEFQLDEDNAQRQNAQEKSRDHFKQGGSSNTTRNKTKTKATSLEGNGKPSRYNPKTRENGSTTKIKEVWVPLK